MFFQRTLFNDKVKLKKRFKFLIIVLINILNCFFKNCICYFRKFKNQKMKKILSLLRNLFFKTIENSDFNQTMQTFNKNVLNSVEIRNSKNVHYELYQNLDVLQNQNNIKICDDEKNEK